VTREAVEDRRVIGAAGNMVESPELNARRSRSAYCWSPRRFPARDQRSV